MEWNYTGDDTRFVVVRANDRVPGQQYSLRITQTQTSERYLRDRVRNNGRAVRLEFVSQPFPTTYRSRAEAVAGRDLNRWCDSLEDLRRQARENSAFIIRMAEQRAARDRAFLERRLQLAGNLSDSDRSDPDDSEGSLREFVINDESDSDDFDESESDANESDSDDSDATSLSEVDSEASTVVIDFTED